MKVNSACEENKSIFNQNSTMADVTSAFNFADGDPFSSSFNGSLLDFVPETGDCCDVHALGEFEPDDPVASEHKVVDNTDVGD